MELQSDEINQLAKALCSAQSELQGTATDGKNSHFKSQFSTLKACISAVREPLAKNGLSVTQQYMYYEKRTFLVTTLLHTSGQWMRSYGELILDKMSSQALGSSTSYMRRYGLTAMLGLYQEDDDGNSAEIKRSKKNECTESEYLRFVIEQKDIFGEDLLLEYLEKKANKYKKTKHEIVFELLRDIELFEKEIELYRPVFDKQRAEKLGDLPAEKKM